MQSRVKSFVVLWAFVMFMCAYTWADSIPSDPVVDIEQSVFNNGIDPPFPGFFQFTELANPGSPNSAACTMGTDPVSCNFTSPQFFNTGAPISELEITINTFSAVDAQGNPVNEVDL